MRPSKHEMQMTPLSVQFTCIQGDSIWPIPAPMVDVYRPERSMDAALPKGGEQGDEDDRGKNRRVIHLERGIPVKEVVRLMEWNGYEVYDVAFDSEGIPCIGLPCFYLVKDGEITRYDRGDDQPRPQYRGPVLGQGRAHGGQGIVLTYGIPTRS